MTDRIKHFVVAHLPPEAAQKWVQHVRDFDIANPGCHFEIGVEAPDISLVEAIEMLRVEPRLTFTQIFGRGPDEEDAPGNEEGA